MDHESYSMLYSNDIYASIEELTAEGSKLKTEIFKAFIRNKEIDKEIPKYYISFVNNFLKYWENFSEDLQDKMKKCNADESSSLRTLDYDFVKDYIYGNYDYASVLQFTDGLIKMNNNGESTKTVEDVEDFFEHTVEKAFNDLPDSVGGLMETATAIADDEMVAPNALSRKMFKTISSYSKLFDENSRVELYKAVSKVVEFISDNSNLNKYLKHSNMKLFISYINNIVEYMTYSLAVYACRIYIINRYAYPFIYADSRSRVSFSEAVELPNTGSKDMDGLCVSVMNKLEDNIVKDYTHYNDILDAFDSLCIMIGGASLFTRERRDKYIKSPEANMFSDALISNELYSHIVKRERYRLFEDNGRSIKEINHVLSNCLFNDKQGIQGSSSPKQEMLHIIRGTKSKIDTVSDCKEVASDLTKFAFIVLKELNAYINDTTNCIGNLVLSPNNDVAIKSLAGEILRMTTELYMELALAIVQRGRDIELVYNSLNADRSERAVNGLKLDIVTANNKGTTSNISNAVPDTTRMPLELSDMYALPSFESLQMYDEYVKSLEMFKDDPYYFNEAVNFSEIVNMIISKIMAVKKRWLSFIHNAEFQNAVSYVIKNESNLNMLQFPAGTTMNVLPFKNNGTSETISPTVVFKNLQNGLKNFDDKSIKTEEDLTKFVKSLYPSETVYKWFTDADLSKTSQIRYKNYILFQNEANASDKEIAQVEIKDSEINKRLKWWIATVKGSSDVNNSLESIDKDITAAVNSIKAKIVNASNNLSKAQPSSSTTNNATPPTNNSTTSTTSSNNNQQAQPNAQKQEAENNNAILSNRALTEINLAIDRLYGSIIGIFISYFRTEYNYIKEAYSKGQK